MRPEEDSVMLKRRSKRVRWNVLFSLTVLGVLTAASDKVYQYLNFDKIADFKDVADTVPAATISRASRATSWSA